MDHPDAWRGIDTLTRDRRAELALEPESFIHRWTMAYHYLLVGRVADAKQQAAWLEDCAPQLPYTAQMSALIAGLEGDQAAAKAHIARIDVGALDGHHMFHLAKSLAVAGETERAMRMLEDAVDQNFYRLRELLPIP